MEPCEQRTPVAVLQEQMKVANKRIADLEAIHEILITMSSTLAEVKGELKNVCSAVIDTKEELKITKADVTVLKEAPGKKFDKLEMTAIGALLLYAINLILNIQ